MERFYLRRGVQVELVKGQRLELDPVRPCFRSGVDTLQRQCQVPVVIGADLGDYEGLVPADGPVSDGYLGHGRPFGWK